MIKNRACVLAGVASALLMSFGTASFADEVTKSTVTTKTADPAVVVTPEPARPAGVVVDDTAGCSTKKVTKTDGDTGDTTKKTTTNC